MDEKQDGGIDGSGADGSRRGGQGADGCGKTVKERVSHGEDEEEEENDPQHIEGENREAVWVVQGRAESWKTHVVAEGVAQHRTHQMTYRHIHRKRQSQLFLCMRYSLFATNLVESELQ